MKQDLRYSNLVFFGKLGLLVLILITVFSWLFSPNHYFLMDDQSHLLHKLLNPPSLSLLPLAAYNDRPVGNLIIWGFAQIFGPNALAAHSLIFALHLLNGFLVYKLAATLLNKFAINDPHKLLALSSAAFFLLWTRSTFAVWWFSAIYDLLVVLFGTLFLIFSFSIEQTKTRSRAILYSLLAITSLLLALRSKEAALLLPLCLIPLQLWSKRKPGSRVFLWNLGIASTMSLVFVATILLLKLQNPTAFTGSEPYAMSFALEALVQNTARFAYSYLSPFEFGLNFQSFSTKGLAVAGGWLALLTMVIWKKPTHRALSLSLLPPFLLILAPTLPLIHTQSKLYLYFPSVFGAIALVAIMHGSLQLLLSKLSFKSHAGTFTFLVVIGLSLFARFVPPAQADINWWLETGKQARTTWDSLEDLAPVNPGDQFIILGTDGHNHSFLYGPGDVIRLKFMQPEISVSLEEIPPSSQTKTRVLQYHPDGKALEITQ